MANRRMFSMTIIDTDYFLELPISSQCLYFHLAMRADDDGFISSPKRIMRMVGSSEDDFKSLVAKNFLIPFESGVCVITHWRIHNYISPDRYTSSFHKYERSLLGITDNNSYTLEEDESIKKIGINSFKAVEIENDNNVVQNVVHDVDTGKDRLGKDRLEIGKDRLEIGKDRLEIEKEIEEEQEEADKIILSKELKERIITEWNKLPVADIRTLSDSRSKKIKILLQTYGEEDLFKAIDNVNGSKFLQGINDRGWVITIDWFLKGNNFIKVLEGNYNKGKQQAKKKGVYRVNGDREEADYKKLANRFMEGL